MPSFLAEAYGATARRLRRQRIVRPRCRAHPPRPPVRNYWTPVIRRACNSNWNSNFASLKGTSGRRLQLKALGQQSADGCPFPLAFDLVQDDGVQAKFGKHLAACSARRTALMVAMHYRDCFNADSFRQLALRDRP